MGISRRREDHRRRRGREGCSISDEGKKGGKRGGVNETNLAEGKRQKCVRAFGVLGEQDSGTQL